MYVLIAYAVAQLKRAWRTPIALGWVVVFPAVLLLLCGGARLHMQAIATEVVAGQEREASGAYADFLMMGLIGFNAVSTGIFGVGMALVQAREQGILRRLAFTPQPAWTFVGGHILASGTLVMVSTLLLLAVGVLAFHVRLPHRLGEWYVLLSVGTLMFLTMGAAMATLLRDLRSAQIFGNAMCVLLMFFGGVWFPLTSFPTPWQEIGHVFPLAYFLEALRAVGSQNQSLRQHLLALVVLGAWGISAAGVAGVRFSHARHSDEGNR